jgi:hypothetical protein
MLVECYHFMVAYTRHDNSNFVHRAVRLSKMPVSAVYFFCQIVSRRKLPFHFYAVLWTSQTACADLGLKM